jgi:hypothetical protein
VLTIAWGAGALAAFVLALVLGPASGQAEKQPPPPQPPPILDVDPPGPPVKPGGEEDNRICTPKKADENTVEPIGSSEKCGNTLHLDWMWPVDGMKAMIEGEKGWQDVTKLEVTFFDDTTMTWVLAVAPSAGKPGRVDWLRDGKPYATCTDGPRALPTDCFRGKYKSLMATPASGGPAKEASRGRIKYAVK